MNTTAKPIAQCDLEIRVRYSECDAFGYLHHARYFEYFELGRTELLRLSGHAYRDMERAGHFFVVAKASCKFIRPAQYDDVLLLSTRIERVTNARINHSYEMRRDQVVLCIGETTIAPVDASGRLTAVPEYLYPRDTSGGR